LQLQVRPGSKPFRAGQQHLVELPRVQGITERSGAIGVADDRLAQLEPGIAQPPRRPRGALERSRPAGRQVDPGATVLRQRRHQQGEGGRPLPGLTPQSTDQLRVLGGAGGNYQRLVLLLVLHLGLLVGRSMAPLRRSAPPPCTAALTAG
jgi:hypothetical protein